MITCNCVFAHPVSRIQRGRSIQTQKALGTDKLEIISTGSFRYGVTCSCAPCQMLYLLCVMSAKLKYLGGNSFFKKIGQIRPLFIFVLFSHHKDKNSISYGGTLLVFTAYMVMLQLIDKILFLTSISAPRIIIRRYKSFICLTTCLA